MRVTATLAATTLGVAALAIPAGTSLAAQRSAPHSAAAQTWTHHVDVDGDGTADTVTLVRGDDLTVHNGLGSGHFTVKVNLAHGKTLSRQMHVSYYNGAGGDRWSPYYGATQIDQRNGRDLVLGFTSGAHAQVFNVLALRGDRLMKLDAPGNNDPQNGWTINSSVGTGSWGYRCVAAGVQSQLVYPNGQHTRYTIDTARYFFDSGWHRTRHFHYQVDADSHGNPPAYTDNYASFDCKGLPKRW